MGLAGLFALTPLVPLVSWLRTRRASFPARLGDLRLNIRRPGDLLFITLTGGLLVLLVLSIVQGVLIVPCLVLWLYLRLSLRVARSGPVQAVSPSLKAHGQSLSGFSG